MSYMIPNIDFFSLKKVSDQFRLRTNIYIYILHLLIALKINLNVQVPLFGHILKYFNPVGLFCGLIVQNCVNNNIPKWMFLTHWWSAVGHEEHPVENRVCWSRRWWQNHVIGSDIIAFYVLMWINVYWWIPVLSVWMYVCTWTN